MLTMRLRPQQELSRGKVKKREKPKIGGTPDWTYSRVVSLSQALYWVSLARRIAATLSAAVVSQLLGRDAHVYHPRVSPTTSAQVNEQPPRLLSISNTVPSVVRDQ